MALGRFNHLNQEILRLMETHIEQLRNIEHHMAEVRSRKSKAEDDTTSTMNSDEMSCATTPSEASTTAAGDTDKPRPNLLNLPVDIFKCICDHLDRDIAYSLKLVCRGLSHSNVVDELLYREPFIITDVEGLRLNDWKYKPTGRERWNLFRHSINDNNRHLVQKIALSHWCTLADFQWVEQNLPKLTSLDLSAIKDFVWIPEETWTWADLLGSCPALFTRIQDLEVCNWADHSAHARIEYCYSYGDYKYKTKFRMTRRRDGSSIPKTILPVCVQLKTLGLRGSTRHIAWNEWEVHQRVCSLTDKIAEYSPATLQKLRVYDIAPLMALLLADSPALGKISTVEVDLYSWMQEYRDNIRDYPFFAHRMLPGTQHRNGEETFDDGTYESCGRNHMDLGQRIVQDVGYPLGRILKQLNSVVGQQTPFRIKNARSLRNIHLHPFHLVSTRPPSRHHLDNPDLDTVYCSEIKDALRWMSEDCEWRPVFTWDTMMCDVFPENLGSTHLRSKPELLSRIKAMFEGLKSFNVPIRLTMGERYSCSNHGLEGSLLFGDFKKFEGEGEDRVQVIKPTQARFNLTGVAHLMDELTIQYTGSMPTNASWSKTDRQLTEGEKDLMKREIAGWRKFWARYALLLKNLKKLTVIIPLDIFNAWGKSKHLCKLLHDGSWQMLETDIRRATVDINDEFLFRPRFLSKQPRVKFIKRVFFRKSDHELDLGATELTDDERNEENTFSDDALEDCSEPHRFWIPKIKAKKRKAESGIEEEQAVKKARA